MKQCSKCEPFETGFIANCIDKTNCIYNNNNKVWDNKFGLMEDFIVSCKSTKKMGERLDMKKVNLEKMGDKVKIVGVGKDAEIITNEQGGKQSKSPMAMHLIDPQFLTDYVCAIDEYRESFDNICTFMVGGDKDWIIEAVKNLAEEEGKAGLVEIGKVLQYGASKYEANNWRLIPEEEHINHALIHYYAHIVGDTQDDHVEHTLCRLMMAYATEKSENFNYNKYLPKR